MLTDKEIQNAQPRDKLYRLSDGQGCTWRSPQPEASSGVCAIASAAKEKMLALGRYPEIRGPDADRVKEGMSKEMKAELVKTAFAMLGCSLPK